MSSKFKEKLCAAGNSIKNKVLGWLKTYWKYLAILAFVFVGDLTAAGFLLTVFLIMDFYILYRNRDLWYTPIVRQMEIKIFGRPLEKDFWTEEEWTTMKRDKWQFLYDRYKRK